MAIKIILLLLNLVGAVIFFVMGWISTTIFLGLIFIYQIYVYMSLKRFNTISYFTRRTRVASMIIYFFIIAIVSRMVNLQIINGNYYREKEYEQVSSDLTKNGKRGTIYDANMKKMAFNINVYNVIIDPTRVYENENAYKVMELLKKKGIIEDSMETLKRDIETLSLKGNRYKVIAKKVDELEKTTILELMKENKLNKNEFFFEKILERKYYKSSTYMSLIGNIGYPKNGKGFRKVGNFGVEKYYENYLREKYIKIKSYFTKSRDIKLPTSKDVLEESLNGKNVILTIDSEINYILSSELEKQYNAFKAEEAYAVIMNPTNGKVVATSYFSRHKKDLRNPIFQDQFEPGSTFKPIVIAAALEEKLITTSSKFDVGDGTLKRYRHTIKEASRSTRGILTPGDIINKSSNVGMSLISERFSEEKFEEYLKKFGLYDRTGVDFPSEMKPYASPYRKWDKLKKYTMSFGQGIVMTPIQLVTAFSSVVNGGILYKPYIVDRIEDQEGVVIRRNNPKEVRRIISKEVSEEMKVMLENNINDGSGKKAIVNGYRIGGKTGTAQISAPGGYLKEQYLSSFIGVFPIEKPEYVVLIMILKPQSDSIYGRFGSSVAAPVFGEIVARITKTKGMMSQDVAKFSSYKLGEVPSKEEEVLENDNIKNEIMPDLLGKSMEEVLELFSNTRFKIDFKGQGTVKRQTPEKGKDTYDVDEIIVELE